MTWKQRARRKLRAEVLRALFPRAEAALGNEKIEPLFVVVPVPKALLKKGALNRRERAQLCEEVGVSAMLSATQAVRKRVGSSAISEADRITRGWTAPA